MKTMMYAYEQRVTFGAEKSSSADMASGIGGSTASRRIDQQQKRWPQDHLSHFQYWLCSQQIKSIQVHHFVPGGNKVFHELLSRIVLRIHLAYRT